MARPSPQQRARMCPRCGSIDIHRVRRRFLDRLLARPAVYRCDECRRRFGRDPNEVGKLS